jgi:hypothetical protein
VSIKTEALLQMAGRRKRIDADPGLAEMPLADGADADAKRTEAQEMDDLQVELALIMHRLKQLQKQYAGKEALQRFYDN